jgi:hypothetical protein
VKRYRFIEAEKVQGGNVIEACELLEVSRSAFYNWHEDRPSPRSWLMTGSASSRAGPVVRSKV